MDAADPFGWVGATLDGKVAVERVVGEGGFGVVYRGTHLGFREPVAVKCLKLPAALGVTQQGTFLASFTEEARLLHRLSKANAGIVQALDVGAANSPSGIWTPYIVMEWLDGETLEQYLASRRSQLPLGAEGAIEMLSPAAAALGAAHAQGVAHRDIKPANLFLARIGGASTLKVLDFGIAKVLEQSASVTQALAQTGNSVRAFSPQYAAPEQFDPRFGATGPWTDVYSFTLVLLEAASGRLAYSGTNPLQLYVLATDEKRRPSFGAAGVVAPTAVETVVRRALAVEPSKRYASIQHMWRDLQDAKMLASAETMPVAGGGLPATIASGSPIAGSVPPPRASEPMRPRQVSSPEMKTSSLREGENRLCTIMFVDVAGLDALTERMAPEEVGEVVDGCFDAIVTCVQDVGGYAERLGADRAMAVFGVTQANEDDAERAVSAALKIEAAISRVRVKDRDRDRKRIRLGARIGINTGWVFTGTSNTRRDVTVTGEPVSAATRLHARATAGATIIGRETLRHVEGRFNVEPLDGGGDELPTAYRVVGRPAVRLAVPRTDFFHLPTKLVGRAAEMQRVEEALETSVAERRTQFLTIVGPPGVGRSRIVADVVALVSSRPELFYVMTARGAALATDTSYGLVGALLRARFELHDDEDAAAVGAKIRRGLAWFKGYHAERTTASLTQSAPAVADSAQLSSIRDVVTKSAPSPLAVTRQSAVVRQTPSDVDDLDEAVDGLRESIDIVAAMLTAPRDVAESTGSVASDDDWRQAKSRKSAAIARLLAFVLDFAPVIVICDDIHWADDASLDVLDELSVRLPDSRLVVACTARSELFDRRPHWGEGKEGHARVEMRPLARRYVEEMLRDRLRLVQKLPDEFVATVVDRAAGNPLVLSETLHLLLDAGVVERRPDVWIVHEERARSLKLPGTIQGIMQARLDRLDVEERELLGIAAVVGETFWEGAIDALRAGGSATGTSPPPLLTSTATLLKRLRERQLVRVRETSSIPGDREHVFAETAMCEVAYDALSRKVRRAHHKSAAAWLAPRLVGDGAAALVAKHFDRADQPKEAIAYYARAAAHLAAAGQNVEALRHYERVSELFDETAPDSEDLERSGATPIARDVVAPAEDRRVASWRDRTRVRAEMGDVLRRLGQYDAATQAHEHSRRAILRNERRGTVEGRVDAGEASLWESRIDLRRALTAKVRGDSAGARRLAERALEEAERAGAMVETPPMSAILSWALRREGDLAACRAAAIAGLRVCRKITVRDARWRESVSQLLVALGAVFYVQRRPVRAERCYRQAAAIVDEATNPRALNVALNNVAVIRYEAGDLVGARQLFVRSLALKEREGDLYQVAIAHSNLAEVELHLGQAPSALEHAKKSVRLGEQAGAHADLADCYRNLAEALFVTGSLDDGLKTADRAVELARAPGAHVYLSRNVDALVRICGAIAGLDPSAASPELRARAKDAAKRTAALVGATFADEKHAAKVSLWSALLERALSFPG